MFAVKGLYDGVAIKPKEAIPFSDEREVVITFLEPKLGAAAKEERDDVAERLATINSLIGILPPTVTDEEAKKARLEKYEHSY